MTHSTHSSKMALPEPFASIPRQALLFSTAPAIEPLDRLTAHLQRDGVRVFVNREDMNSGLGGGGGNKLRKLEYGSFDHMSESKLRDDK